MVSPLQDTRAVNDRSSFLFINSPLFKVWCSPVRVPRIMPVAFVAWLVIVSCGFAVESGCPACVLCNLYLNG